MKKKAPSNLMRILHSVFPAAVLVLLVLFPPQPASARDGSSSASGIPEPEPWPDSFHALLYMNLSRGNLQMSDLWYDWGRRRNLNLMQKQLGVLLHDVEWDNGTSFYYVLPSDPTSAGAKSCQVMLFPVGVPRRDFMRGANYLGRRYIGGFLCDVWEKVEFIWYYQDVKTKRPVGWDFYDGISTRVMTYEPGAQLLDEAMWQAPDYCFSDGLVPESVQLQIMPEDDDRRVWDSFRRLSSL